MKQKRKFGCGTIVWIVIGLMFLSALSRVIFGGRDTQEQAKKSDISEEAEESSISAASVLEENSYESETNQVPEPSAFQENQDSSEEILSEKSEENDIPSDNNEENELPEENNEENELPEDSSEITTEESAESVSESDAVPAGVTPEFKETMDSYEAFFDEYIAFMEVYANTDDTTAMMTEYLSYMTKYMEVMQKLGEINEEELSDADALYYTEVQLRISQKLLAVSD